MDWIPEYVDIPTCCKCRQQVDPLKMRIIGKKGGTWQCSVCNTRYTQLHRKWGGWPSREFEKMWDEDKAGFWCSVGDAKTQAEQDQVVMNTLKDRVIESRLAGSRGEYQPLGWYKRQGYDWKRIRKTCTDKKPHPNLGMTYRVNIEYQDKHKEYQKVREEILKSIQEKKADSALRMGSGKSKGKGSGKGKDKTPAPTIATKKMQGDAVKILAKVSPMIFTFKTLLKHKKLALIPEQHVATLKQNLASLQDFEGKAQKTVSQQALLEISLPQVAADCTSGQSHCNLMQGMLNSLA